MKCDMQVMVYIVHIATCNNDFDRSTMEPGDIVEILDCQIQIIYVSFKLNI